MIIVRCGGPAQGELTPEFEILGSRDASPESGQLLFRPFGPVGLDRLDAVTISILNEPGTDYLGPRPAQHGD